LLGLFAGNWSGFEASVFFTEVAAAWAQAFGSVIAIAVSVVLWRSETKSRNRERLHANLIRDEERCVDDIRRTQIALQVSLQLVDASENVNKAILNV